MTKITKNQIETQEAWNTASLATGWTSFDAGGTGAVYGTPQYMKDSLGFVHLRGLAKNNSGATNNSTTRALILTLPVGYRPNQNSLFSVVGYNGTADTVMIVSINGSDGTVSLFGVNSSVTNTNYLSTNGITFKGEA